MLSTMAVHLVEFADRPGDPWWTSTWPAVPDADMTPAQRAARDLARIVKVLDDRRQIVGMDIGQLAGRCAADGSISVNTAKNVFDGEGWPKFTTLYRIAEVLGVSLVAQPPIPPAVTQAPPVNGQALISAYRDAGPAIRELVATVLRLKADRDQRS